MIAEMKTKMLTHINLIVKFYKATRNFDKDLSSLITYIPLPLPRLTNVVIKHAETAIKML